MVPVNHQAFPSLASLQSEAGMEGKGSHSPKNSIHAGTSATKMGQEQDQKGN
jgi:hypothetical protein